MLGDEEYDYRQAESGEKYILVTMIRMFSVDTNSCALLSFF